MGRPYVLFEPGFHCVSDFDKLFFRDDVRNYSVNVADEGPGKNTTLIGEFRKALDCLTFLYFNAETAAHHADFFYALVLKTQKFPFCDFFYFFDFFDVFFPLKDFD